MSSGLTLGRCFPGLKLPAEWHLSSKCAHTPHRWVYVVWFVACRPYFYRCRCCWSRSPIPNTRPRLSKTSSSEPAEQERVMILFRKISTFFKNQKEMYFCSDLKNTFMIWPGEWMSSQMWCRIPRDIVTGDNGLGADVSFEVSGYRESIMQNHVQLQSRDLFTPEATTNFKGVRGGKRADLWGTFCSLLTALHPSFSTLLCLHCHRTV